MKLQLRSIFAELTECSVKFFVFLCIQFIKEVKESGTSTGSTSFTLSDKTTYLESVQKSSNNDTISAVTEHIK